MPKSKNNKSHRSRLNRYKTNKKKEQESFKKKMIENYIKMQQEAVAEKEAHTSTQEVTGPEVNVDELIEPWNSNNQPVEVASVEVDDIITDSTIDIDNSIIQENDNDNK